MSSQENNINPLKELPFYGKTMKLNFKQFSNAKLLSELPFFKKPIKAKIKQVSIKKLLSEQKFYKQPIKNHVLKSKATKNYYVSYHFMMILIFQKTRRHLEGMSKPIK